MVNIYLQNIKMNPKIIKNPMDVFQKIGKLIDNSPEYTIIHLKLICYEQLYLTIRTADQ